jgi:hypothetical protein
VFSGVTDIPRIDAVQTEAIRTEEFIWNNTRDSQEDELDELVSYDRESKSSALLD